ncbi:hypothetical protein [Burkholderia sp. Nafp2/4-1b]|uniref:hypothetical protein n=1 Tax=Burkholderia sp. Nafp2/4-1b TaxID=2116686 RepID=UPI000EF91C2D|nr:hypothetical protein [Burkholderia sp. Nafp2/4-1b]
MTVVAAMWSVTKYVAVDEVFVAAEILCGSPKVNLLATLGFRQSQCALRCIVGQTGPALLVSFHAQTNVTIWHRM